MPFFEGEVIKNSKNTRITKLKIFFSKATLTISIKYGTKHAQMIHFFSNEGPSPSPRGDTCNTEHAKRNYNVLSKLKNQNLKIF